MTTLRPSATLAAILITLPAILTAGCDAGSAERPRPATDHSSATAETVDEPAGATDGSADVADPAGAAGDAGGEEPGRAAGETRGPDEPAAAVPAADDAPSPGPVLGDAPLEPWRRELLMMAYEVASEIPVRIHHKDRAAAQQLVIDVAFELDQLDAALEMIRGIENNWRRGDAMADLAFRRAELGERGDPLGLLELAEREADLSEGWRRDRIRVNVARTMALVGRDDRARELEVDVIEAESGIVDSVRARDTERSDLETVLAEYETLVAAGGFDLTRNLLVAAVQLYDRFYDDPIARELIDEFIVGSWGRLPADIRIDRLIDLADVATERGDTETAMMQVDRARTILDGVAMAAEFELPLSARVATRRAAAGDRDRAVLELEQSVLEHEAGFEALSRIFRAEALAPVAEAWTALGEPDRAAATFRRAVEEGAKTGNSRPRAQDLSATVAAMARAGFRPDEPLMERMREIKDGLGEPW